MSLRVWTDVADSLVERPAFSVVDGLARGRALQDFTRQGVYVAPNGRGVTLGPVQLTPGWASAAGKWGPPDFLTPSTGYEWIEHRAAGDWFLASRGLAGGARIPTAAPVVRNGGLFLEMFCYAPSHTRVPDVAVVEFGGRFALHVHSDGTADLSDLRPGAPPLIVGAPLTAGGQDLAGRFVTVMILPWRRGWVLVQSSQGGFFEAFVGETRVPAGSGDATVTPGEAAYHVTTEAAQAAVTFSPLARCLGALNPLTYPPTGLLTSPTIPLPYPARDAPANQVIAAEQQDGARAALTLADQDGAAFAPSATAPPTGLRYALALSTPDPRVSPQVFGVTVDWDRALGTKALGTAFFERVQSAKISLSRERGAKSFSFVLDNPADQYTALKDLYNRSMYAEFVPDGHVDTAASVIFAGQTDPAEFLDGQASKITVPCVGRRKRLRTHLLNESRQYDGVEHGEAVRQVLLQAGIADANIVVVHDGVALDAADPGDDPLWRPDNGTSADEWCTHIAETFSGWVFDDIGGTFYYVPASYFTDAVLNAVGVPEVLMATPTDPLTRLPRAGVVGAPPLVALAGSVQQTAQEPRANDLWVLGRDPRTDEVVGAHYEDWDSIHTRTAPNWVGERRLFIYASASITTTAMAQRALGVIAGRMTRAVRCVKFDLPDYQQALLVDGPVYLDGYGYGLISDVEGEWTTDRFRRTTFTAELF